MQSNIISLSQDAQNLDKILCETQKTAVYADLTAKQALRLRLIAEELVGMLKELSVDFEGSFWIDGEGASFSFTTQISINENMDRETKQKFIDISSDKKNAAATGVMGKIRDVVENLLYPENAIYSAAFVAYQLENAVLMNDTWTLNRYKDSVRDSEESWDELEKSIIANLADDVAVSVKGNKVEILITKNFNKEN